MVQVSVCSSALLDRHYLRSCRSTIITTPGLHQLLRVGARSLGLRWDTDLLSFSTTNADLEALFGQVGAVTSATVIMDKITGRSRGFGFVEMANAQDMATAIERFNGADMQGRALTVNEAKPQEPRAGGGRSF